MISNETKIEKREAMVYEPLPAEELYQCELLDITPSQQQNSYHPERIDTVLSFQFVVLDEGESRGRSLWFNYVPSYFYDGAKGKNKLYQVIEALIGHELSPEEEAKTDANAINGLIGNQVKLLTEIATNKKGNQYNKPVKVVKIKVGLPELTAEEKENAQVKNKKRKEIEELEKIGDSIAPF